MKRESFDLNLPPPAEPSFDLNLPPPAEPSFDLNLPSPAEPPERRFVVGYALLPEKQLSLIQPSLVNAARDRGVDLVPVDPSCPLAEQGPFDCVIHKLHGGEWKAQLADFAAKNPGVPIVDHPLAIERLHDRIAMLQLVSQLDVPHGTETVGVPKQAVLRDSSAAAVISATTDLRFPVIANPLISDGRAKSDDTILVFRPTALPMLKSPLLLQEFINPGGFIFNVYVAGSYMKSMTRNYVPEQHHFFAPFTFSGAFNQTPNSPNEVEQELPPLSFLKKIAMNLRQATGLRLFNFCMIMEADGRNHYLITDVDYFPDYSEIPHYEEFLTNFFWETVHEKSAAASSSLSA